MRAGLLVKTTAVMVAFTATMVASDRSAHAWKPYTHNTTALEAYRDAVDDGTVTLLGRTYSLSPALLTALRNWPQFYNAGVIGPDGFPDLTYGQSVIHPGSNVEFAPRTGAWLGHIFNSAMAAQTGGLSATEKEQILAWSFGFLTHGAGDMWGHTFVNDFARGVFPGVGEILTDVNKAAIALRHIAAEGYVGDATPGFDGFQTASDARDPRAPAPGGDVSDDSTPALPYDAPHAFIFRTLVDPAASTPSAERGPLIGFFLNLRSNLRDFVGNNPDPLGDAINAYNDTVAALNELSEDCDFDDVSDIIDCPAGLLELGFDVAIDSAEAFFEFVTGTVELAAKVVLNAYVGAWIDDIDDGLRHWSELGLATTRGLFDPQARRNLQNEECEFDGPDDTSSLLRANCEAGVGMLDTVLDQANDFINDHLLSMVGAPDLVGDLRAILQSISDFVDEVIGIVSAPFNPLREAIAEVKQFISDLIEDAISELLGVDIEALRGLLTEPSRFTCLETLTFNFPAPLGTQSFDFFTPGTHDRLDTLLGFAGEDHHVPAMGLPPECGRLQDNAELAMGSVAATANTITMSKLLLLDGSQLNQALGDILDRQITTYGTGQNVMVEGLTAGNPWLMSIDSDHAWRQDGQPRFCNEGTSCPAGATPRPALLNGGAGNFPIWESCVLRPAFRQLFSDWEGTAFPDFGDVSGEDPANDPNAPTSSLARSGTAFNNGTTIFVAANNLFTLTAQDTPVGRAFRNDQLGLQRRIFTDLGNRGTFLDSFQGETFSLTGPDGTYFIGVRSADPCHSFSELPAGPEAEQVSSFFLDTTPPQLTCPSPPFALTYDTASTITLSFSVSDGPGSGVAQSSSTVDGVGSQTGTSPTTSGTTLDLFLFYPGTRHVSVSSADNLGNAITDACTFELHATVESLGANLARAFAAGLITNQGVFNSLTQKMDAALSARNRGQTNAELNILAAFVNELQAQRGNKVAAATADRFIAFAQDLIAIGG
jgi:hypothetical protein